MGLILIAPGTKWFGESVAVYGSSKDFSDGVVPKFPTGGSWVVNSWPLEKQVTDHLELLQGASICIHHLWQQVSPSVVGDFG